MNNHCFSKLIVGTSKNAFIMGAGHPDPGLLRVHRDVVFHALSIPHVQPAERSKINIVIRHKTKRHAILNEQALADHLSDRYNPRVYVKVLDFETLSPEEEVYAMSNATIFITPMGGGSFDANLMQDNAVVIFTEPCSNQVSAVRQLCSTMVMR